MNILRKYKISKLFNVLLEEDSEVIGFINSWLDDLIIFTSIYYPNITFYMTKKGRYVFEHINNTNEIIVRWKGLISILDIEYNIQYYELLKYILKVDYNINMEDMLCKDESDFLKIEYEFSKEIQNIENN